MEESGKTTVSAVFTVWSADRKTKKCFTCPCDLNSVKRKGCVTLYDSDKDWEKTMLVREDEGTECCDDGVLNLYGVMREKRLQLLRPGEIWEPTSATPDEIRHREISLKEKQEERRRTTNNFAVGIGAVGGSVALGAGIAAWCACPPLAAVYIIAGVGGSTMTVGSVGYSLTLPPKR